MYMEHTASYDELKNQVINLQVQLEEANETINAIRNGQVDALIVRGNAGNQLFTLKTADQTYRVFIEKMSEGAVTLDSSGIILYSNSQFAAMVNTPLSHVIGSTFKSFIADGSKHSFEVIFDNGWKQDSKAEILLSCGDQISPFQLSLTTLELDEGISLSIILTDLTTQKKTQQMLASSNEELEKINVALELSNVDLQQFASIASHDLQEPLRKMQIFSSMLKTHYSKLLPDEGKKYLEKIIASSNRMRSLIVDVLDFSRLSEASTFENTDLKDIVNEVLDDFEIPILEKRAVIVVEDLPVIAVNRGQIRQVFHNLISNSLKFCNPVQTPSIVIASKRVASLTCSAGDQSDGLFCRLYVTDNGIGFEEEFATQIFSIFHRLHSRDRYEGTGVGLAITKRIIDKHNGTIKAHSKKGKGAEFIITLPVSQDLPSSADTVSSAAALR